MSAARAPVEDVPIIDFVNYVQADAVKQGLTGADAALPVLSIAAPFNRSASFPAGDVSRARRGRALHLRQLPVRREGHRPGRQGLPGVLHAATSSRSPAPAPTRWPTSTNAVTPTAPNGTPDYNFDTIAGLDARLTYDVDIAQPVGSRIANLAYGGAPVAGGRAVRAGGQQLPPERWRRLPARSSTAPVVYSNSTDIRQLLIDWVGAHHTIDPTQFASVDWRLVANGQPITIT